MLVRAVYLLSTSTAVKCRHGGRPLVEPWTRGRSAYRESLSRASRREQVGRPWDSYRQDCLVLMTNEKRSEIRTLRGRAISVLEEAGAIRECEEHGWAQDRADPHARERAFDIARRDRPSGISPEEAVTATVAWRDRRPARPKFSMEGIQVVRMHKRGVRLMPSTTGFSRPLSDYSSRRASLATARRNSKPSRSFAAWDCCSRSSPQ
jgi:hypothetical protein